MINFSPYSPYGTDFLFDGTPAEWLPSICRECHGSGVSARKIRPFPWLRTEWIYEACPACHRKGIIES